MKDQVTSVERPLRLVNGKFMRGLNIKNRTRNEKLFD